MPGAHSDYLSTADEMHSVHALQSGIAAGNGHAGMPHYPCNTHANRPRHSSFSMPALPAIGEDVPLVPSSVKIMDSVVQPPASHLPPLGDDGTPVQSRHTIQSASHTPLDQPHSTHAHPPPPELHVTSLSGFDLHGQGEGSRETHALSALQTTSSQVADSPMRDAVNDESDGTSHHLNNDNGSNSSNAPARQALHTSELSLYGASTPVAGSMALARRRRSSLHLSSQDASLSSSTVGDGTPNALLRQQTDTQTTAHTC